MPYRKVIKVLTIKAYECPCGFFILCNSDRDRYLKLRLHKRNCNITSRAL